jgi:hypothetical protein
VIYLVYGILGVALVAITSYISYRSGRRDERSELEPDLLEARRTRAAMERAGLVLPDERAHGEATEGRKYGSWTGEMISPGVTTSRGHTRRFDELYNDSVSSSVPPAAAGPKPQPRQHP